MFNAVLKFEYPGNLQLTGKYTIEHEAELPALEKLIEHLNDTRAHHDVDFDISTDGKGTMTIVLRLMSEEHQNHLAALKAAAADGIHAVKEIGHDIATVAEEGVKAAVAGAEHLVAVEPAGTANLQAEEDELKAATEKLNEPPAAFGGQMGTSDTAAGSDLSQPAPKVRAGRRAAKPPSPKPE